MCAFLLNIYINFMLDKLMVQNLCREPPLDWETFASRPKKEEKMCTQDNICNNFVLPALHSEASPLISAMSILVALSWWRCTPSRVRASTLPVGQETSKIFGVPFDHSGHALGGGANKPTGVSEIMHGPKLQIGQGGSVSVPPSIEGTLWSNPMGPVIQ